MFKSIKRRIDNANQMHRMRNENPEALKQALEEQARAEKIGDNIPPVKPGPLIRFFRWVLLLLTALILLVVILGVPRADNPLFSLMSFGLLLSLLYLAAGLAHPSIVFVRRKWPREDVLELFGLLSIVFIVLMVVFHK
ncbi:MULTISPECIES: hypothetical protein [unclassified Paenibacillus]|uniref:hypothetical protein n=1 Tax=unclassified Paenibacillus TaxID=185978 RepID=UPI0024053D9B|nr:MULTISPECIES: hypothetical protein [unclassified Paenibacillus]MDF9844534.1 hypothetical protein [Paenibacillus sp. PastF-2]MDF9851181.1 hypothetical protein [Paenibacillus sp. PastM-2]MDF9856184.1 hypothetical protein [Paenibacillus sp. PastF-1]MDH6481587.1 hypothetical protein [Paenibacillus sp. PastH-2]MDH6510401.1 hypothetical protein [Paenibacillus sp. PastM-3]